MKLNGRSNSNISNDKGFTIIEVLVVIGLFAIGILAVASMQVTAFQGNRSAMLQTNAITLATERMENLISQDYAAIVSGNDTEANFDISWTVLNDTPMNNTKTITVTVTWNDRGGNRDVELNNIVARLD